ncbi:uncharacterized protein EDB91DRAFT_1347639 [Suillus paluster]|uniref:uncharacterized protein n=1 Tax=Suillus paluster TaxID=48578 RepID=UPI001B8718DA|nr:uncharacterized protein EDB91DRAFT_1347639 [Suillus paluster]KAG1738375.1 hypothetical protein EDB91DRAFT_1347639 [Suillus paluster]
MISRLHAMYQRSRKMLIVLIAIFLAVNITCAVIVALILREISGQAIILSGTYQCGYSYPGDTVLLISMVWILNTVWEVFTLFFALWIAVKHLRELQRSSTGWTVGDCFTMLIKTHLVYFASFAAVSCLQLGYLSPTILESSSVAVQLYGGALQIFKVVQMFLLGPRLILSVREYHAKLVADSDSGTAMTSIAFQSRVHMSTGSGV